jgi:hypothetical protein
VISSMEILVPSLRWRLNWVILLSNDKGFTSLSREVVLSNMFWTHYRKSQSTPSCTNHTAVRIAEFMHHSPIHEIVIKKLAFANSIPYFHAILHRSAYNNSFNFWLRWGGGDRGLFSYGRIFLPTLTDIVNKWNVASDLRAGSVTSFCEKIMNLVDLSYAVSHSLT